MTNQKFTKETWRANRLLCREGACTTRLQSALDTASSEATAGHDSSVDGTLRIVSIGHLNWRNGYEYLLVAIHRLVKSGIAVQFHLIGEGEEKQRILFTIFDLQLQDHVILHGNQPRNKCIDCIRQGDVFVLSSLAEITTEYLFEAMAHGLPVVTTDCRGIREVVADGVNGLVVPVRDPNTLALALQKLATSQELRYTMGKAGRECIIQKHERDES